VAFFIVTCIYLQVCTQQKGAYRMKNKIVKALVLASIVSMTATGAAGLTFADDDVVTGDTTSTSTEATTTTKTVDQLAEALTEAQEDAATKEAAFTKAYEDNEAAKAAVEALDGYADALKKQDNEYTWANPILNNAEDATYRLLGEVSRAAQEVVDDGSGKYTTAEKNTAKTAVNTVTALNDAWTIYRQKKDAYKTALDAFQADRTEQENHKTVSENKKAAADAKAEYEEALKKFNEALAKVTEDAFIKDFDNTTLEQAPGNFNIRRLKDAIETEEKYRKAVNDALDEIKKIKDERSEIDEDEVADRHATAGLAARALKKATKEYNAALANVKTGTRSFVAVV